MGIIVQKYGGTSLKDLGGKSNLLKCVKQVIKEGDKLVIVVSAMGRKGDPYATDTLLEQLYTFNEKVDPKKKDLMMSCGETISTAMISHYLEIEGFPSEPFLGLQAGIVTDNNFNDSNIIDIKIENVMKHLEEGKIAVVAGFQGATADLDITTLGRGGSDITAVALGGFLGADRVDIYTDVPGVALIDPNLFSNAKYVENISYDNMYKFAANGAKVINPMAVSIGKNFNIPIRILSTYKDSPGTLISTIDNDEKIIGITVNNTKEHTTLSLFLKKEFKDEIGSNLKAFNKKYNDKILNIQYFEDRITYIINNKDMLTIPQKLYQFIIK